MSPSAPIMSSWIWPRNIGGWRSGYLMNCTINCISVVVVTMWNSFYSLIFCVLSLWLRLCESETVVLLLFSSFSPSRLASQGLLSLDHQLLLVCQLFLSCSRTFWKFFGSFLRVSLWSCGTTLVLLVCKLIVWNVHQWGDLDAFECLYWLNWCGESNKVPGPKTEQHSKVERFKRGNSNMISGLRCWVNLKIVGINSLLPYLVDVCCLFQRGQKVKLHFHRSENVRCFTHKTRQKQDAVPLHILPCTNSPQCCSRHWMWLTTCFCM